MCCCGWKRISPLATRERASLDGVASFSREKRRHTAFGTGPAVASMAPTPSTAVCPKKVVVEGNNSVRDVGATHHTKRTALERQQWRDFVFVCARQANCGSPTTYLLPTHPSRTVVISPLVVVFDEEEQFCSGGGNCFCCVLSRILSSVRVSVQLLHPSE